MRSGVKERDANLSQPLGSNLQKLEDTDHVRRVHDQMAPQAASRLREIRQQERGNSIARAKRYRGTLDDAHKQLAKHKGKVWEQQRSHEVKALQEQHQFAVHNIGQGQLAADEFNEQRDRQRQDAAARKPQQLLDEAARFAAALHSLHATRGEGQRRLQDHAARRTANLEAERCKASQFAAARAQEQQVRLTVRAEAVAEEAERRRNGQHSLIDFRYSRHHERADTLMPAKPQYDAAFAAATNSPNRGPVVFDSTGISLNSWAAPSRTTHPVLAHADPHAQAAETNARLDYERRARAAAAAEAQERAQKRYIAAQAKLHAEENRRVTEAELVALEVHQVQRRQQDVAQHRGRLEDRSKQVELLRMFESNFLHQPANATTAATPYLFVSAQQPPPSQSGAQVGWAPQGPPAQQLQLQAHLARPDLPPLPSLPANMQRHAHHLAGHSHPTQSTLLAHGLASHPPQQLPQQTYQHERSPAAAAAAAAAAGRDASPQPGSKDPQIPVSAAGGLQRPEPVMLAVDDSHGDSAPAESQAMREEPAPPAPRQLPSFLRPDSSASGGWVPQWTTQRGQGLGKVAKATARPHQQAQPQQQQPQLVSPPTATITAAAAVAAQQQGSPAGPAGSSAATAAVAADVSTQVKPSDLGPEPPQGVGLRGSGHAAAGVVAGADGVNSGRDDGGGAGDEDDDESGDEWLGDELDAELAKMHRELSGVQPRGSRIRDPSSVLLASNTPDVMLRVGRDRYGKSSRPVGTAGSPLAQSLGLSGQQLPSAAAVAAKPAQTAGSVRSSTSNGTSSLDNSLAALLASMGVDMDKTPLRQIRGGMPSSGGGGLTGLTDLLDGPMMSPMSSQLFSPSTGAALPHGLPGSNDPVGDGLMGWGLGPLGAWNPDLDGAESSLSSESLAGLADLIAKGILPHHVATTLMETRHHHPTTADLAANNHLSPSATHAPLHPTTAATAPHPVAAIVSDRHLIPTAATHSIFDDQATFSSITSDTLSELTLTLAKLGIVLPALPQLPRPVANVHPGGPLHSSALSGSSSSFSVPGYPVQATASATAQVLEGNMQFGSPGPQQSNAAAGMDENSVSYLHLSSRPGAVAGGGTALRPRAAYPPQPLSLAGLPWLPAPASAAGAAAASTTQGQHYPPRQQQQRDPNSLTTGDHNLSTSSTLSSPISIFLPGPQLVAEPHAHQSAGVQRSASMAPLQLRSQHASEQQPPQTYSQDTDSLASFFTAMDRLLQPLQPPSAHQGPGRLDPAHPAVGSFYSVDQPGASRAFPPLVHGSSIDAHVLRYPQFENFTGDVGVAAVAAHSQRAGPVRPVQLMGLGTMLQPPGMWELPGSSFGGPGSTSSGSASTGGRGIAPVRPRSVERRRALFQTFGDDGMEDEGLPADSPPPLPAAAAVAASIRSMAVHPHAAATLDLGIQDPRAVPRPSVPLAAPQQHRPSGQHHGSDSEVGSSSSRIGGGQGFDQGGPTSRTGASSSSGRDVSAAGDRQGQGHGSGSEGTTSSLLHFLDAPSPPESVSSDAFLSLLPPPPFSVPAPTTNSVSSTRSQTQPPATSHALYPVWEIPPTPPLSAIEQGSSSNNRYVTSSDAISHPGPAPVDRGIAFLQQVQQPPASLIYPAYSHGAHSFPAARGASEAMSGETAAASANLALRDLAAAVAAVATSPHTAVLRPSRERVIAQPGGGAIHRAARQLAVDPEDSASAGLASDHLSSDDSIISSSRDDQVRGIAGAAHRGPEDVDVTTPADRSARQHQQHSPSSAGFHVSPSGASLWASLEGESLAQALDALQAAGEAVERERETEWHGLQEEMLLHVEQATASAAIDAELAHDALAVANERAGRAAHGLPPLSPPVRSPSRTVHATASQDAPLASASPHEEVEDERSDGDAAWAHDQRDPRQKRSPPLPDRLGLSQGIASNPYMSGFRDQPAQPPLQLSPPLQLVIPAQPHVTLAALQGVSQLAAALQLSPSSPRPQPQRQDQASDVRTAPEGTFQAGVWPPSPPSTSPSTTASDDSACPTLLPLHSPYGPRPAAAGVEQPEDETDQQMLSFRTVETAPERTSAESATRHHALGPQHRLLQPSALNVPTHDRFLPPPPKQQEQQGHMGPGHVDRTRGVSESQHTAPDSYTSAETLRPASPLSLPCQGTTAWPSFTLASLRGTAPSHSLHIAVPNALHACAVADTSEAQVLSQEQRQPIPLPASFDMLNPLTQPDQQTQQSSHPSSASVASSGSEHRAATHLPKHSTANATTAYSLANLPHMSGTVPYTPSRFTDISPILVPQGASTLSTVSDSMTSVEFGTVMATLLQDIHSGLAAVNLGSASGAAPVSSNLEHRLTTVAAAAAAAAVSSVTLGSSIQMEGGSGSSGGESSGGGVHSYSTLGLDWARQRFGDSEVMDAQQQHTHLADLTHNHTLPHTWQQLPDEADSPFPAYVDDVASASSTVELPRSPLARMMPHAAQPTAGCFGNPAPLSPSGSGTHSSASSPLSGKGGNERNYASQETSPFALRSVSLSPPPAFAQARLAGQDSSGFDNQRATDWASGTVTAPQDADPAHRLTSQQPDPTARLSGLVVNIPDPSPSLGSLVTSPNPASSLPASAPSAAAAKVTALLGGMSHAGEVAAGSQIWGGGDSPGSGRPRGRNPARDTGAEGAESGYASPGETGYQAPTDQSTPPRDWEGGWAGGGSGGGSAGGSPSSGGRESGGSRRTPGATGFVMPGAGVGSGKELWGGLRRGSSPVPRRTSEEMVLSGLLSWTVADFLGSDSEELDV